MTTILCTLYNSLYLDKGLVLYDSLCECAKDFKLYVLCMDDKCYEVLTALKQEHHIPVRLSDFEKGDAALLEAKGNRPMGEYCWTCSSSFIRYVLNHYKEESCTYIDADMYFYNDPKVLIDEMLDAGKSVMVVPHRFPENKKKIAKWVGNFCVEFNTFLNIPESLEVLEYWRAKCLECCSRCKDGIHYGDQKYLDQLVAMYDCVYPCAHPGAGLAPWNIVLYQGITGKENTVFFRPRKQQEDIIFYHYQGVRYITKEIVSTAVGAKVKNIDYSLVDHLYCHYLHCIDEKKKWLNNVHGVNLLIKAHPVGMKFSGIKGLLRRTIAYKILNRLRALIRKRDPYFINLRESCSMEV